jgi:hypothetical protein
MPRVAVVRAAHGMRVMTKKLVAFGVIAALAAALAVGLRSANRADAAGGNCYSDAQGPASPTICS